MYIKKRGIFYNIQISEFSNELSKKFFLYKPCPVNNKKKKKLAKSIEQLYNYNRFYQVMNLRTRGHLLLFM